MKGAALMRRGAGIILSLLLSMGLLQGCGGGGELLQVTIEAPEDGAFLKGFATIRASVSAPASVQRLLFAVRYQGKDGRTLYRILKRVEGNGASEYTADWDTSLELDGPYTVEVELLQTDQRPVGKQTGNVWVVNKIAQLSFKECVAQPFVVKEKSTLTLTWADASTQLPETTVELFVQGQSVGRKSTAPYVFDVDFSSFQEGQELSLNAVAIRGAYNGATAVCQVLIDRTGPEVRFVFPAQEGAVVPAIFNASVEVEEAFGVQEVRIKQGGKVVGTRSSPPFLVPVDLSGVPNNQEVTLVAEAVDRAGNVTAKPPSIKVKVDSSPPVITIRSPLPGSQHVAAVDFEVAISDDAGIDLVDFYILDEADKRLDNILHETETKTGENVYKARITNAVDQYGPGQRSLEVVARDTRGNVESFKMKLVFGCREDTDCPTQTPAFKCLGNRCLVPRQKGDQCSFAFSCEPPLVCHFGGLNFCTNQKIGFCREDCTATAACPQGQFCLPQENNAPSVCFPGDPCNPATFNCDASSQCTPWGNTSFVCLPLGKKGPGEACTPYACTEDNNCVENYICVPGSSGTSGTCRRICDREFVTRDCGANKACQPFPLLDATTNDMGYCQ